MEIKGFFVSLFDLSFKEFVTTRIIRILFILAIIGSGIGVLAILIGGISKGGADAFVAIILSLVVFILYVIMARVCLEVVIAVFRIAENTGKLVEQSRSKDEPAEE